MRRFVVVGNVAQMCFFVSEKTVCVLEIFFKHRRFLDTKTHLCYIGSGQFEGDGVDLRFYINTEE